MFPFQRFSLIFHNCIPRCNHVSYKSLPLIITEEVKNALENNIPVVALESTIISHGMPYPQNLDVALKIEQTVRDNGCIPATIAIIDGIPKIGLAKYDLEILAGKNKNINVIKASSRDLSFACTNKITAGTTVASTMILAHMAGIQVFATGGIGGVHRGAESTFDVSADLYELAKTPVTVVCAGVKSILDIPKTLEVLETNGVPVITFKSDVFPAFFSTDSGCPASMNLPSAKNIAEVIHNHTNVLRLRSGIVVGVPNPDPMNSEDIEVTIKNAIDHAKQENVTGAKLTPYILAKLEKVTCGKSLEANISLVLNNAKIASEIAYELTQIQTSATNNFSSSSVRNCYDFIGFGGAVFDIIAMPDSTLVHNTSNPGSVKFGHGGVSRNICEAIARKNKNNKIIGLVSVVANDKFGQDILRNLELCQINTSHVKVLNDDKNIRTATYTAVHDNKGSLAVSIADMDIFMQIDENQIESAINNCNDDAVILLDGNLSEGTFQRVVNLATLRQLTLAFDATSDFKCILPLISNSLHKIHIIKPNISELAALVNKCIELQLIKCCTGIKNALKNTVDNKCGLSDIELLARKLFYFMIGTCSTDTVRKKHLIVSMGAHGIMWIRYNGVSSLNNLDDNCVLVQSIPLSRKLSIRSDFNGAGDAFFAGVLHQLMLSQSISESSIKIGIKY